MRKLTWIFAALLAFGSSEATAQEQAPAKKWDLSGTAAVFEARPNQEMTAYEDNWYFHGRYAVAFGHYWNEHLKTEVEYAKSGEGSVFQQNYKTVDGQFYPYGIRSFHQLEQASARMVWQFGHNAWVHPYVSGGLVVDRDRERIHIPAQYQFVNGRTTMVMPDVNTGPTWKYRVGTTVGAGAKLYLARNAYFNSGIVGTWSRPSATLSLFAGFGFDF